MGAYNARDRRSILRTRRATRVEKQPPGGVPLHTLDDRAGDLMQGIDARAIFPRRGGGLKKSRLLNLISGNENNRVPIFFKVVLIFAGKGIKANPLFMRGFDFGVF